MKFKMGKNFLDCFQSPPSRGAWIEIIIVNSDGGGKAVAPLAGGVD